MQAKKSKLISFLKNNWPFFGYFLISIVFLSPILIQDGVPFKYDWGWPLFSMNEFWRGLFDPNNSGILVVAGKYLNLFLGLPSLIGLSPSISLKLFLLSIHTFAGYGFFLFLNRRGVAKYVSFICGLAYAFSPYIFIRTIVGFLTSLIAYAVLPFFIDRFISVNFKRLSDFAILGLLLTFIFAQIQAGVLTLSFLLFWMLIPEKESRFITRFKKIIFLGISTLAINLPWIVVSFFSQKGSEIPVASGVTTLNFIASLPHSLMRVLMLSDHHITYTFFSQLDKTPFVLISFALIYLIALFAFADKKNRSLVISIMLPAVAIIPFSIGPTSFFATFYTFAYNHFSYLALFRETYHFEFWLSFALISIFAFGINWILNCRQGKKYQLLAKIVAAILVLAIVAQYFSFNYFNRFSLHQLPKEYDQLNAYLKKADVCSKIYYPPSLGFIYFANDLTADGVNTDLIAKSIGISSLTDGASVLNIENAEMYTRNRLTSHFLNQEDSGEFAELLSESGADCMIVRTDLKSNFYLDAKINFETDISIHSKWIENDNMLALAQSKKNLVLEQQFGSNIYIYKLAEVDRQPYQNERIAFQPSGKKLPITIWANEFNYYKDGWIRGRYAFWRKEIFADLMQNFIYTTKVGATLSHQSDENLSGELLIRYFDNQEAGSFELTVDEKKFVIEKNGSLDQFVVKSLGQVEIKKGDMITIKSISGENAIADLVINEK